MAIAVCPVAGQKRVSDSLSMKSFDAKLAAVRAGNPKAVKDALGSTNGILIAVAVPFAPPATLVPVFERLSEDGAKRDPACRAKLAIGHALLAAEMWEPEVFERGLHITQREGYEQVDTAGGLRALCGHAHARMYRPDAVDVLADLLADPMPIARLGAAQALGLTGQAGPLRLRILVGESDPEVLAACFESLFAIDREQQLPFVLRQLHDYEVTGECAALALGSARIASALDALVGWCAGCSRRQRADVGYVALALLRSDGANAFLLEAVRSHGKTDAIAAARALATFREANGEALRAAAAAHRDPAVPREVDQLLA